MSQQENKRQARKMPSLAKIGEVAKAQKKQKETPKPSPLRAYIVFTKPLEVDGVMYDYSLSKKGNKRDPHRHYIPKHTNKDERWSGKEDMTVAQMATTDAFAEIVAFMASVWTAHPLDIKVVEIYLNTVKGRPCIVKYDRKMLADIENYLFSDEPTK